MHAPASAKPPLRLPPLPRPGRPLFERRRNRPDDTASALVSAFDHAVQRAELDVLIVTDESGILVSNSTTELDLAMLAAVTPLVARGSARADVRRDGVEREYSVRTIKVLGESSVGSNLRRIEATTGENTLKLLQRESAAVSEVARMVGAPVDELVVGVQRRLDEIKALHDEVKVLRAKLATGQAADIAAGAIDGIIVSRVDGLAPGDLRDLAVAVRQQPGVSIVVLGGVTDAGGVSLVAAVTPASGRVAGDLIKEAAKAVGGGGGGKGDIATAGGKNPEGLDEALRIATAEARAQA